MIGTLHARLDGRVVPTAVATAVDPRARVPVPFGLYETLLVRGGRAHRALAHGRRLAAASRALGLGILDAEDLARELSSAAPFARGARARLRLLRWADADGPRHLLTLDPEPPPPSRIILGVSTERRPRSSVERRHKRIDAPDLDRARAAATAAGFFDLLVLDEDGTVLEGAKTNVFWRTGRTIRTPSADLPILPGTARARLLDAASRAGLDTEETTSGLGELLDAEEVIVTNALLGTRRLVRLVPGDQGASLLSGK